MAWQFAQAIAVVKGWTSTRRAAERCGHAAEPKVVVVEEVVGEGGVEDVIGVEVEAPPPPPPPPEQPTLSTPTKKGRVRKVRSEVPKRNVMPSPPQRSVPS
ncbi:MAG: hypothetical protein KDD82_23935 [Planctomycetes bacterium]|nr:hypothetical protein [Planctomycetota bacterium]